MRLYENVILPSTDLIGPKNAKAAMRHTSLMRRKKAVDSKCNKLPGTGL